MPAQLILSFIKQSDLNHHLSLHRCPKSMSGATFPRVNIAPYHIILSIKQSNRITLVLKVHASYPTSWLGSVVLEAPALSVSPSFRAKLKPFTSTLMPRGWVAHLDHSYFLQAKVMKYMDDRLLVRRVDRNGDHKHFGGSCNSYGIGISADECL